MSLSSCVRRLSVAIWAQHRLARSVACLDSKRAGPFCFLRVRAYELLPPLPSPRPALACARAMTTVPFADACTRAGCPLDGPPPRCPMCGQLVVAAVAPAPAPPALPPNSRPPRRHPLGAAAARARLARRLTDDELLQEVNRRLRARLAWHEARVRARFAI